ncbi:30S ribosomal protein S4e [Candidatus Woesearchaeota archaeon]|nr:30S ribosomal protein S4e [Candidatus Woesearchaeota archaeon]
MGKNHIKRFAAPKTWQIKRKGRKFIAKQAPGPHNLGSGIPLSVMLKEVMGYAGTTREAKKILNSGEIKIDGKPRKDLGFPVGIFDAVEFSGTKEHFRVVLGKKGKIALAKISKDEALTKPCKITGKTAVKGRLQLNLYDGKNIIASDKAYSVGDTLMMSLPDQKISKHLKLGKNSVIILTGGKHIGELGSVENIVGSKIVYKDEKGVLVETSKKYAFVIGDSKPLITLGSI